MKLNESLLKDIALKSLENAKELIDDALILKQNERLARSYTLFQLAIEEIGKSISSMVLLVTNDYHKTKEAAAFFKEFKSHEQKNYRSAGVDILIAEIMFKGNHDGAMKFLEKSFHGKDRMREQNDLKNWSLYTSIVDNKIQLPNEIIKKSLVNNIHIVAINRLNATYVWVRTGIENLQALKDYYVNHTLNEHDIKKYAISFWEKIDGGD